MGILAELFIWWDGNTIGTRLATWRNGVFRGEDGLGNRYYEARRGLGPAGKPRRWVIYKDRAEASLVPPEWHGWLHYTVDTLPEEEGYRPRAWERPHRPNMTGTPAAWHPPGSIARAGEHRVGRTYYEPWRPGAAKASRSDDG